MSADPPDLAPELCVRAAGLRGEGTPYAGIARELGLPSSRSAQEAARIGYGLAGPQEVTGVDRTDEIRSLRGILDHLVRVIQDPGPLVVNGSIVTDPRTGEPVADRRAVIEAVRQVLAVRQAIRWLSGIGAASLEEIKAAAGKIRAEIADAENEGS